MRIDGTPHGWAAWRAFLVSDRYSKDVDELLEAFERGTPLDIGLSIECLASCAFSAGLDVPPPEPAAAVATTGARRDGR